MTNEEQWTADIPVIDGTLEDFEFLVFSASAHGDKVCPITGGEAALGAARSVPPDPFLLYIGMPNKPGSESCYSIRL